MRKLSWLAAIGVAALVAAGAAVAHGGFGKAATPVAATFTATTVAHSKTTTCTNSDGTWSRVDASYTGTSTGDADLTGAARLDVHALINTTKDLGVVTGSLRIDTAGPDTKARFSTVYSAGKLAGLAEGRAHDPGAQLLANVSAAYSTTGGFTAGKIGGQTDGGLAVELASASCSQPKAAHERATLEIKGTVVSVSSTALVVKSGTDQVTCTVDADHARSVAKLQAGQRVEAKCLLVGGAYQLQSAKGKH
jgi:hypothetical protein